jgi:hypothetical protein
MSVHAYRRVIDALEAHSSNGRDHGARAQYQCPAHGDDKPSLGVNDAPERALVHCFAGCDSLDVLEALGLEWGDLFDEPATGKGWSTATLRKVGAQANGDGRITLGSIRYLPVGEPKTLAGAGCPAGPLAGT